MTKSLKKEQDCRVNVFVRKQNIEKLVYLKQHGFKSSEHFNKIIEEKFEEMKKG